MWQHMPRTAAGTSILYAANAGVGVLRAAALSLQQKSGEGTVSTMPASSFAACGHCPVAVLCDHQMLRTCLHPAWTKPGMHCQSTSMRVTGI